MYFEERINMFSDDKSRIGKVRRQRYRYFTPSFERRLNSGRRKFDMANKSIISRNVTGNLAKA